MQKYSKTPDPGTILISDKVKQKEALHDQEVEDADKE